MSDRLKSAFELAMEKLTRKDKESKPGSTAPEKLTARQKGKIAKIRREAKAKLAEREILFKSEQRSARGDPEQMEKIEEAYRRDRERLLSRQEEQIQDVRRRNSPKS